MTASPITILALNPAVDISYEVDQLLSNKKVRSSNTCYYPGGNGINISRSLEALDLPFACYSIVGGESGQLLLRLLGDPPGENYHFFEVQNETRLNAIIQQKNPPEQYEVDSIGPEIPSEVLATITRDFTQASINNIAILSGSVPAGVDHSIYRTLIEQIQSQGGRAIVDAHGEVLQQALQASPYLLRLNRYVLEMTVTRRLEQPEDVAHAAREIQKRGIKFVCISLSSQGAILVDDNNSYYCPAPKVRINSTVGCGDAMVAGIVSAIYQNKSVQEMLRFGIICGSTTASHHGTELFNLSEVMQDKFDIQVERLDI